MVQFGKQRGAARHRRKGAPSNYAGSKRPPRTKRDYADVHGTEYQRFYNILCIAYGHDPKTFEDYVQKNVLPAGGPGGAVLEYRKIERAFRIAADCPYRRAADGATAARSVRPDDGRP